MLKHHIFYSLATVIMVITGTVQGWTTVSLPQLKNGTYDNLPFSITNEEISWIVCLKGIGSIIGRLLAYNLVNMIGPKSCLLLSCQFFISGWFLVLNATTLPILCSARIILGIGVGITNTVYPTYILEMADSNVRDALTTLSVTSVPFGSLMSFCIGSFVSDATLVKILLYLSISSIPLLAIFPESPLFLTRKGCITEACEAISFFKDTSNLHEARKELVFLRRAHSSDARKYRYKSDRITNDELREATSKGGKSWLKKLPLVLLPNNIYALFIGFLLITVQHFNGYFCIMEYFLIIYEKNIIDADVNTGMILILSTALVFAFYFGTTLRNAKRRGRIMQSTILCMCVLIIWGLDFTFFIRINNGENVSNPIVFAILYQITFQLGLGMIPNVVIDEIFSPELKDVAAIVVMIYDDMLYFVQSKMYLNFNENIGIDMVYYYFGISCLFFFKFIDLFMPETRGKTNRLIQEILKEDLTYILGIYMLIDLID